MLNQLFNQGETFIFVFIRIIFILMLTPFFGSRNFPVMLKMGLAALMTLIIAPVLGAAVSLPETIAGLMIAAIREALIGAAIGFVARLVFSAIEMAGYIIGIQMGYAVATVFDPHTTNQISVTSQFYNLMAFLLFFSLNAHLIFINAIKESFDAIPPYGFSVTKETMHGILLMTSDTFRIAVKLSAPVMVSILLANIAMGILSRTIPQMNIFVVGFPVTMALGLIVLLFSMPFMISAVSRVYIELSHNIVGLLKAGG